MTTLQIVFAIAQILLAPLSALAVAFWVTRSNELLKKALQQELYDYQQDKERRKTKMAKMEELGEILWNLRDQLLIHITKVHVKVKTMDEVYSLKRDLNAIVVRVRNLTNFYVPELNQNCNTFALSFVEYETLSLQLMYKNVHNLNIDEETASIQKAVKTTIHDLDNLLENLNLLAISENKLIIGKINLAEPASSASNSDAQ